MPDNQKTLPDELCLLTFPHDFDEECLTDRHAEPGVHLRDGRVIGRRLVELMVQEPPQGEVQPGFAGQLALTGGAIQPPEQRQIDQDDGSTPG